MSDDFMHKTLWLPYGEQEVFQASYGFSVHGQQEPFFFVTGELRGGTVNLPGKVHACGCRNEFAKACPSLAFLVKWHLFSTESGPLHYEANALFWWEYVLGARVPERFDSWDANKESASAWGMRSFHNCVVFGAIREKPLGCTASLGEVRDWLRERLPRLKEQFEADMKRASLSAKLEEARAVWKRRNA